MAFLRGIPDHFQEINAAHYNITGDHLSITRADTIKLQNNGLLLVPSQEVDTAQCYTPRLVKEMSDQTLQST